MKTLHMTEYKFENEKEFEDYIKNIDYNKITTTIISPQDYTIVVREED